VKNNLALIEEFIKIASPEEIESPRAHYLYRKMEGLCPVHGTPMRFRDIAQQESYCPLDEGVKEKRAMESAQHEKEEHSALGDLNKAEEKEHGVKVAAMRDEIEKIAILGTVTAIGSSLFGANVVQNFIQRHGMKYKGIRRVGSEIAGIGLRHGVEGKKLAPRLVREGAAHVSMSGPVGLYEAAHSVGTGLKKNLRTAIANNPKAKKLGDLAEAHKHVTDALMPHMKEMGKKFKGPIAEQTKQFRDLVHHIPLKGVRERLKEAPSSIIERIKGRFKK
jgi:hypothetical protein